MKRYYHVEIAERLGVVTAILLQEVFAKDDPGVLATSAGTNEIGLSENEINYALKRLVEMGVLTANKGKGAKYDATRRRWLELEGTVLSHTMRRTPPPKPLVQHALYSEFDAQAATEMTDAVLALVNQKASADAGNDRILVQAQAIALELMRMGWEVDTIHEIKAYYEKYDFRGKNGEPINLYHVQQNASPARADFEKRQKPQEPGRVIEVFNPDGTSTIVTL